MQSLAVNGYSALDVKAALHRPGRTVAFKYEHLDLTNKRKGWLTQVVSGQVSNNATAEIKRTGKFSIDDEGVVDWLQDRLRPWFMLQMPGGWAEWPLGVFLLSSPKRSIGSVSTHRAVEAYDQLLVLRDDKTATRYVVTAGTNVIDAVRTLLESVGITWYNLVPTGETMPVDREWEPGTSKLQIINDLLTMIAYQTLYFNAMGYAVARPYMRPDQRGVEYTYAADKDSILSPEAEHELDYFEVPNM